MTVYKNQLSTCESLAEFIEFYPDNLTFNALEALLEYEGTLDVDYDDYIVFFVDYDKNDNEIFAITKILDHWQPVEVNDRIRKFTRESVWPCDNYIQIRIF